MWLQVRTRTGRGSHKDMGNQNIPPRAACEGWLQDSWSNRDQLQIQNVAIKIRETFSYWELPLISVQYHEMISHLILYFQLPFRLEMNQSSSHFPPVLFWGSFEDKTFSVWYFLPCHAHTMPSLVLTLNWLHPTTGHLLKLTVWQWGSSGPFTYMVPIGWQRVRNEWPLYHGPALLATSHAESAQFTMWRLISHGGEAAGPWEAQEGNSEGESFCTDKISFPSPIKTGEYPTALPFWV